MGIFNPHIEELRLIIINAIPRFKHDETLPCGLYTIFDDTTERKQTEYEREILLDELTLVNSPNSMNDLTRQVTG
jgi:hypothetical protein